MENEEKIKNRKTLNENGEGRDEYERKSVEKKE